MTDDESGSGRNGGAHPAGLLRRLAALAYDMLVLLSVVIVFTLAAILLTGAAIPAGTLWFQLLLAALLVLFFPWFWTHGGQTVGARAWRLRVVAAGGGRVGWGRALLRLAAGIATLLPAAAAALWSVHAGVDLRWLWAWSPAAGLSYGWGLADARRRCLHDLLSGTRLIHEPPVRG